jgi:DNA-binding response OmpR family regulator
MVDKNQKTILILEDEDTLVKSLHQKFSQEGFEVISAQNGQDGWDLLQKHSIDLVLVDIVMPEKDGLWFVEKLNQDDRFLYIPIIVLTNLTQGEKIETIAAKGVKKIFIKTQTSLEEIENFVKETLRQI